MRTALPVVIPGVAPFRPRLREQNYATVAWRVYVVNPYKYGHSTRRTAALGTHRSKSANDGAPTSVELSACFGDVLRLAVEAGDESQGTECPWGTRQIQKFSSHTGLKLLSRSTVRLKLVDASHALSTSQWFVTNVLRHEL